MSLPRYLSQLSVGTKLNILLFVIFALLVGNIVLTTQFNIDTLFSGLGDERVADEDALVSSRLLEFNENLIRNAQLLAESTDAIRVAGGLRDTSGIRRLSESAPYNDVVVEVVNNDGDVVFTSIPPGIGYMGTGEGRAPLVDVPLLRGANWSEFVLEDEADGAQAFIGASVPVINEQGNRVGALVLNQPVNVEFLNGLRTDREAVDFFLVADGEVIATNSEVPVPAELVDSMGAREARLGQSFVNDDTVTIEGIGETRVAYFPFRVNFRTKATMGTLIRFDDIAAARQQITATSILGVVLPGALALVLVFGFVYLIVTRPISRLNNVTEQMAGGDLTARAESSAEDEVGQLATSINTLASQIQARIADVEEARDRAERSDQVKSSFLASMSHELRTPLNAVINFTKFVARGDLGPVNDEQKETLEEVVDSAKHLLNLINDVLDMSKIESGSLNLFVVDNIDLKPLVEQAVSSGKVLLEDKPVEIHTEVAEDLPAIRGDRQRIVQILLNIISNACKFTDEGSITVKAQRADEEVIISVADTGSGIAKDDQASVFQAFMQTDLGLRQGGGTGLGMPITKNLVEAHGGTIDLESEPGKGTTFTVKLPVTSEQLVPTLA